MRHDAQGLVLTTASDAAAAAYDHLVNGYLKYRLDLPQRLKALLAEDPEFGLAHCIQGYFTMLAYKQSVVPMAAKSEAAARRFTEHATLRERAHVDALAAWIAGDLDRAIALWEHILAEHPRDVIAFRLAHFVNFWLGRPQDMLASVERVMPAWSSADGKAFGSML
ncbi:MAG: tetratricopeptide repeat protein, partial [Alphaproteobacteria bacterium]|nr:tetratricopeptide repeat protein [Alphaproteobacteria bacterium]